MVFQLYSHSHLYEDSAAGTHSRKYSKKSPKKKNMKGKEPESPVMQMAGDPEVLAPPPRRSYSLSPPPRSLSSAPDLSRIHSLQEFPPQNTLRLVAPSPRGSPTPGASMHRTGSADSDRSEATLAEGQEHQNPLGQEVAPEVINHKAADIPQLSWFMTVSILAVVSVVWGTFVIPKAGVLIVSLQLVAVTADWLVVTANAIAVNKYISKEWTGLILLPTVRAIAGKWLRFDDLRSVIYFPADCVTAVNLSVKDQLTLSSGVAIGSTVVSGRFLCCGSAVTSSLSSVATFTLRHPRHRYRCVDNGVPVRAAL